MLKFNQFCNFERSLGKIGVFKNGSSGIRKGHFRGILGSFSNKKLSYKKSRVIT